jgi:hypothetical protein
MNIEELILENNAMLKVLLKKQARMIAVLSEAIDKLNKDASDEHFEYREKLVELQEEMIETEVNRLKLKMKIHDATGN